MKKKKIKLFGFVTLAVIVIAGGLGAFEFFKPHRNVQNTKPFAALKVQELTNEFTRDAAKANAKYLADDGNSKVLIVDGRVSKISVNQSGEKVILLKEENAKVGVICTFTKESSITAELVKVGDFVKIKGSITAGNSYDADLDLFEHAILIQSAIIKE